MNKHSDCIFCKIINGEIPSKKIYEDEKVIVIMDVNPVVDGHVLVIPKNHFEDFASLDDDISNHIHMVAKKIIPDLMNKLGAKGLTQSVNYGKSQVVKHFHLHLLPDYGIKKQEKSIDEVYDIIK